MAYNLVEERLLIGYVDRTWYVPRSLICQHEFSRAEPHRDIRVISLLCTSLNALYLLIILTRITSNVPYANHACLQCIMTPNNSIYRVFIEEYDHMTIIHEDVNCMKLTHRKSFFPVNLKASLLYIYLHFKMLTTFLNVHTTNNHLSSRVVLDLYPLKKISLGSPVKQVQVGHRYWKVCWFSNTSQSICHCNDLDILVNFPSNVVLGWYSLK